MVHTECIIEWVELKKIVPHHFERDFENKINNLVYEHFKD